MHREDLRGAAKSVLERFAAEWRCTAILNIIDGDHMVCMVSVEPATSGVRVAHREGRQHPLGRGASGIAGLAALPPRPGESLAVRFRNVYDFGYEREAMTP